MKGLYFEQFWVKISVSRELKAVSFEVFRTDFKALWSWISAASSRRGHCLSLPTMVTQSGQGPAARTVVLRDVVEETLIFFTDCRSAKVLHIEEDPRTCLHAYDSSNRFQIQLYGSSFVLRTHAKMDHWRKVGLQRFADYGSCAPPGAELPSDNAVSKDLAAQYFTVVQFCVNRIELLKLRREGHWRAQWVESKGEWSATELVP